MDEDFITTLMWAALLAIMGLAMCVAGSWADQNDHGYFPEPTPLRENSGNHPGPASTR